VNLNSIGRVQKYSSQEGHAPKLSTLGTPQWERLKERAKKRIKDIARELITLYARRKREPGFSFSPDSHWLKEMEASFLYEDTPDQAKATLDVKQDMRNSFPMDRLICGDVGFGKTEVAVRAAFKAVLNGKQAAVLVPTTILAAQHTNTFHDRLGRYGVKIASLTRFKSKKEQAAILDELKSKQTDIVVGTHRMLSKDVQFNNLGLLIIDEEHRFGVSAKEKLRQLRATVDTLTLTATPIPRTLQFSLLGARDLSIINTPPRNRLPIITEIAQFDLKLIREAVLKELHRGGQVYVVHDRVHDIDTIQGLLEHHIREARFHIAHGQMPGHELEKAMMAFLERQYDVLICTKIIESGIDIPSVNTIIINRADRFGMAELYQLRGRVGRSNVQAYAYLLTPPLSSLPRPTLRRLQAIQEFTELGSGFNLALRDLEIRGAGNLLGAEQSGFILEMGFETYQRIVEEAVRELKEQEFTQLIEDEVPRERPPTETLLETDIEALIPDLYVESDSERLDLYRRLYRVSTLDELESFRTELRDRFGEYPPEVDHLIASMALRVRAIKLGLSKVSLRGSELVLTLPPSSEKWFYEDTPTRTAPFQTIMTRLPNLQEFRPTLKQQETSLNLHLHILQAMTPLDRIDAAQKALETLDHA
jgi:transcription-repair coupling factor (superfamily II helicase)